MNLADGLVDYRVNPDSIIAKTAAPRDADYRRRFEQVVTTLASRHALELFGSRGLTPEEAQRLGGFGAGIDAGGLGAFLDVFARILSWYEAMHPDATTSPDFLNTVARQYDAIAYRVRPPSRRQAVRVYAHALRRRPQLARVLSWPRVMATVAFGWHGRARLAAWNRARAAA